MKQFFIDFFKGQQEKFKTPFFSSLLIAIVICYCDVIYYILFEDEKASLKIISAKAMVDDKNIYFPFFLSAVFLIIPIFVNYLYQILLDKFIYKCKENKANLELNISDAQYKLKLNNAKEKYADEKVKIEHAEKIESIKLSLKTKGIRINELESNVVDRELIISQKDELITAITSTLDNAKKQLEHTEVQLDETQKKLIEIRKKLDLSIIEGKRFSDMNATLRRKNIELSDRIAAFERVNLGFNDYRKDSASKFRLLSDEEKESYGSTEDILSYINEIDAEGKSVNIKDGNKRKVHVNENGKRIIKRHWGEGELITSGKDNELNADIDDNECIYLSKDGRYIISDKKNDGSLHAATGDNYKKSLVADLRKSSKIPVKNDNE